MTGSSVPVLWLARETLVQCVGGCSIRVAEKTCSSRCACDFSSGSGGRARDSVRAAASAHSPPLAERKAPRTPPLVEPARSCRVPRERLGGALPSAERSMPARPPLLETVETVEAPQPPGRMALRQHANDAAFAMLLAAPTGFKGAEPSNALTRFRRSSHTVRVSKRRSLPDFDTRL